eukprot:gnl/Spiro4/15476_TR8331_c0_g1_i2.p3 gnl/Spiro4/15476_TR8331_c0_g1~~gnl/Spiro4/15476_TR8331_c0_g1_i2.p3  ORF type:complete len:164 (+),score=37.02 gnl/Spiro4/15476_TR8331_c0_g1_i2:259-750(+)
MFSYFSGIAEHMSTYHGRMGAGLTMLSLTQGFLGSLLVGGFGFGPCFIRSCKLGPGVRFFIANLHRWLGFVSMALAVGTTYFGMWLLFADPQNFNYARIAYACYAGIMFCVVVVLEIRKQCWPIQTKKCAKNSNLLVNTTQHHLLAYSVDEAPVSSIDSNPDL